MYHRLRLTNIYRLAIAVLLALLTLSGTAQAQTAHTFRLYPEPKESEYRAYFVYEASPGTVIEDTVLAVNPSSDSVHLSLYAADAVTASNGGIAIATQLGETPHEAGAWLQLTETDVTIAPAEEANKATAHPIPFRLTIPDNIPPGEYAASIVAQPADALTTDEQVGPVGVRFIPRTATTVLVTIPGPEALQAHLEISTLQAETNTDQQIIVAELNNMGNAGIPKTEGILTIRDIEGSLVHEVPVRLGYFLAADTLLQHITLNPTLESGQYDVTLSLTYQEQTVEQTERLSLGTAEQILENNPNEILPPPPPIPWLWIIIAAIGASLILLLITMLIIQSRRLKQAQF